MGYNANRGNTAAQAPAHGEKKSIFVPITGLFKSESGKSLGVMVTQNVLDNLGQIAVGDKIVFFTNQPEAGKPDAALRLIKASDLEGDAK